MVRFKAAKMLSFAFNEIEAITQRSRSHSPAHSVLAELAKPRLLALFAPKAEAEVLAEQIDSPFPSPT